MAHAVLVFVEQRNGEIKKSSLEALGLGRTLASDLGGTVAAVIAGEGIAETAASLGAYGAAAVYVADDPVAALYSTEAYAAAVAGAAAKAEATLLILSATAMGKDLAPRLAARLGWSYLADATEAAMADGRLTAVRPRYAGRAIWKLAAVPEKVVLGLRPNSVAVPEKAEGEAAPIEAIDVSGVSPRARTIRVESEAQGEIDVAEADIVVSGGRGLKEAEGFSVIRELAGALGGAVGASRAVVDAGWIGHDHQVGQTGKTVSPSLYIAAGISGAIQHVAGMRTSKCIVAVNKDPEAPIFQVADYGIVGDLFEVLPKLTEAVHALKG